MGYPVARGEGADSVATNHPCDASTDTAGASTNVFVNGKGIHRAGDLNAEHEWEVNSECVPHATAIVLGSTTVSANGRGVARLGDSYTEGETVSSGSLNVHAG